MLTTNQTTQTQPMLTQNMMIQRPKTLPKPLLLTSYSVSPAPLSILLDAGPELDAGVLPEVETGVGPGVVQETTAHFRDVAGLR